MSVGQIKGPLAEQTHGKHHEHGRRPRASTTNTPHSSKEKQFAPWERAVQSATTGYEATLRAQQSGSRQSAADAASALAIAPTAAITASGDMRSGSSDSWRKTGVTVAGIDSTVASTRPDTVSSMNRFDTSAATSPGATGTNIARPEAPATSPLPTPAEDESAGSSGVVAPEVSKLVAASSTGLEDAGRMQHYGSLPVLVSGQLVELDLYSLSQRAGGARETTRKLYLSLNSTGPSPVEVVAQASDDRLRVSVESPASVTPEALSEHVRAVGELAQRLGWKFATVEHANQSELAACEPVGARSGPDGLDRLL